MASPGILVRLWGRAQSSPVLALLSTAVVLFMGLVVAWGAARNASRRKMRELHGCRPARRVVTSKYFGLAFIYGMVQGIRNHRFLEQLVEQFEANGHTHAVRILGGESTWTIEPDNIRQVLAVNFKDYSIKEREPVLRPLLGRGIFVTDGEDWARSRALLRPNFAKDQVADLSMIERHIQLFLQRIPNTAEMIDLHELIQAFTMDSSTEFLFGESTNTLAGDLNRDFSDSFTLTLDEISIDLRMGWLSMFRRKDPRAAGANRLCRDHTTKYVNQALAYRKRVLAADTDGDASNHDNRRTFLREIALATDDRERICDELLSILMAGRDTMASLLGSMLFVLARKPDVWAKVRAEVQQAFGDDLPTYQQLRDLKYAKYCINETLRLFPPVPMNTRMAVNDTVLPIGGGPDGKDPILVPKDSVVIYPVFVMHRRPDIFGEDAAEFRPERWEDQKWTWEYLPFNGGPRICLGQQYALTEGLYFLVRFAQEFGKLESMDPEPWTEKLALTVCSANGVKVKLQRAGA